MAGCVQTRATACNQGYGLRTWCCATQRPTTGTTTCAEGPTTCAWQPPETVMRGQDSRKTNGQAKKASEKGKPEVSKLLDDHQKTCTNDYAEKRKGLSRKQKMQRMQLSQKSSAAQYRRQSAIHTPAQGDWWQSRNSNNGWGGSSGSSWEGQSWPTR